MSALNFIFAAHGIIQAALALQFLLVPSATSIFFPGSFDVASILLVRFYGAAVAGMAAISLLCRDMPNMLPCKRGAACGFMFYHGIMTLIIFQSRNDGLIPLHLSYGLSVFHGFQAFVLYAWFTATAGQVKAFLKQGEQDTANANQRKTR